MFFENLFRDRARIAHYRCSALPLIAFASRLFLDSINSRDKLWIGGKKKSCKLGIGQKRSVTLQAICSSVAFVPKTAAA